MIDWLTISIPFRHTPVQSGRLIYLEPTGEVEWECPKRITVRGSYESSAEVRSRGDLDKNGKCGELQISGNPAKYLQGHNAFGSDDANLVAAHWFKAICTELGIKYQAVDVRRITQGKYSIGRVDINYLFNLNHKADVQQFLQALGETSGTKYKRAYNDKGSVYFNKTSQRWSAVVYNKAAEMKSRHKSRRTYLDAQDATDIAQYISTAVRWEFRLNSLELKDLEIKTGADLMAYGPRNLFDEYMKRIEISGNMRVSDHALQTLPDHLRGTYELWRAGCDVRACVSRMTFYRHKKQLRERLNVNIDSPQRSQSQLPNNVVSVSRVLIPEFLPVPQWAYSRGLVVHQRAA